MQEFTYSRSGDYLIPDLALPEQPKEPIGKYGLIHLEFIKEHKRGLYLSLKMTGKLPQYLLDIQSEAKERIGRIQMELLQADPGPDKETDQMGWVQHRNHIKAVAEELVSAEMLYC